MKSAKAPMVDGPSSRRSQPVRQTRTNPPRSSARMPPTRDAGPSGDQPIDIFPAITHFADAMTALPKELVRHFTLLKEVDAKIFTPEEQLFKLVTEAAAAPRSDNTVVDDNLPSSAPMSIQESVNGAPSVAPSSAVDGSSGGFDPANVSRRQLFSHTSMKIQEMLVSLEEKNHVISTANEALHRQLARIEDVWPYLLDEFSDEAKWGSTTHWAYPENRTGRSNAERARRDGAAAISAAAQALVDEAAARSDARKQAVQAKKNMRNNHNDDDDDGRHRDGRKTGTGKSRKTTDNVGLGISAAQPKKRKVEKPAAAANAAANAAAMASPAMTPSTGGVPMERALSGVYGSQAGKTKTTSPRATPAPEQKKRKALPTSSTQAVKKSRNGAPGASPSITSSPVPSNLSEPKTAARASPNPGARPASSRARQNSINSNADGSKARPPSSTANKPNGKATETPEPAPPNNWPRPNEPRNKEESVPPNADREAEQEPPAPPAEVKKEGPETRERRKSESIPLSSLGMPMVTTKSGRASKPSTPAIATFQEAARARLSRNAESGSSAHNGTNSRSDGSLGSNGNGPGAKKHQKRGSTASVAAAARMVEEAAAASRRGEDDDGDVDADEPRYCYCNGVSYGEMVACDSDDCTREWFHLACVGLKVAPGSKTKWYCEDCKERLKMGPKKPSGR